MPNKKSQQRRKRGRGAAPKQPASTSTTTLTPAQQQVASTVASAGNAAVVAAQQPKVVAPKVVAPKVIAPKVIAPGPVPQQAAGPVVYKNVGERMAWLTPHLTEYQALTKAKRNQLDQMPFPVTSAQLDAKLAELKAPTAPKLSSTLSRASWAVQAGLSSTTLKDDTLGLNKIGVLGGQDMHLTLYKDSNKPLDVSLGFRKLFANVLQEGGKPPLHVTVELDGKDATTNPRAYSAASGPAWVHNVTAEAAEDLGLPGEQELATVLKKEVKAQVSMMRNTLRPSFAARGGTKP